MLKTLQVLLIFLLSLSQCVISKDFDEQIQEWISYVSGKMGSCGEYFKYQRIDGFINGKLELPHIKMGDTVKLTFDKMNITNPPHFNGILLPDESSAMVIKRIQNGQLISYRVDFPLMRIVPTLIKMFVNENEFCATEHNRSDEIFHLTHTMQIINGSLPVFTYNIYIPNFIENTACGLVDPRIEISEIQPLIYGGSEIVRGEYPWLTAIYTQQRAGINFLCGGSLVTSKIILTAAHSFQGSASNADKVLAVLGRHNLNNYLEDGYMIHEIETLILHPEYKYRIGFSDADLAILKVKNHVSFTQFIKPICLWFGSADESLVINKTAIVASWGSDEDGYTTSVVPKKFKLDMVSENACQRSSTALTALTSSSTLCAENHDASGPCKGDSGDGVMINRYGRWLLRGVVSAGLTDQGRCKLQEYTVYSDVAKHTEWLEKYVAKEKLISGSIEEICGISGTDLRSEHPWLAAVYKKEYTGIKFKYTGVLISSRTVLTRSVSFITKKGEKNSPDTLRIYLGRYDLNNIQENRVVTRDVESIIFHPDYNKSSILYSFQKNGIALIQMKSPVVFTEFIKPICLWSELNDGQSDIVEQSAILSGWDRLGVYNEGFTVPLSVKVNITSLQQCQSWGYNKSVSSLILCVPRIEPKNGAILIFKRNGRWLLRGVSAVNSDYLQYKSKHYFAYHDLAKHLTWIKKNILS